MRFLLDQDVYAATVRFLSDLRHDVSTASQIGASRAGDAELLRMAREADDPDQVGGRAATSGRAPGARRDSRRGAA